MACNNTGPLNASFAAQWGITDFDWLQLVAFFDSMCFHGPTAMHVFIFDCTMPHNCLQPYYGIWKNSMTTLIWWSSLSKPKVWNTQHECSHLACRCIWLPELSSHMTVTCMQVHPQMGLLQDVFSQTTWLVYFSGTYYRDHGTKLIDQPIRICAPLLWYQTKWVWQCLWGNTTHHT